jgi:hypothetical protein
MIQKELSNIVSILVTFIEKMQTKGKCFGKLKGALKLQAIFDIVGDSPEAWSQIKEVKDNPSFRLEVLNLVKAEYSNDSKELEEMIEAALDAVLYNGTLVEKAIAYKKSK